MLNSNEDKTIKIMFLSYLENRNFNDLVDLVVPVKVQRDFVICKMIEKYICDGKTYTDSVKLVSDKFTEIGERQIRNIYEIGRSKYLKELPICKNS